MPVYPELVAVLGTTVPDYRGYFCGELAEIALAWGRDRAMQ